MPSSLALTMAALLAALPVASDAFRIARAAARPRPPTERCRINAVVLRASGDRPDGGERTISSRICEVLIEARRELLSDPSLLAKRRPISALASDDEARDAIALSAERAVRESLLSTRLHLPFLNRTEVRRSTIDGAGRGLFATEDIAKGEVITCYPGDALLYCLPSHADGGDEGELEEQDWEEQDWAGDLEDGDDDNEEEEEYAEEMVLWGAHVPEDERWDEDAVFDGTESNPPLTAYTVFVDDSYSIMGERRLISIVCVTHICNA